MYSPSRWVGLPLDPISESLGERRWCCLCMPGQRATTCRIRSFFPLGERAHERLLVFVNAKGAQAPPIGCACLCAPHRLHGERGGCLFGRLRLFRKFSIFHRLCVLLGAIASGRRNCRAAGKAGCCCTQCVQCCVTPGTLCFPRVRHAALDMQPWGGASREA